MERTPEGLRPRPENLGGPEVILNDRGHHLRWPLVSLEQGLEAERLTQILSILRNLRMPPAPETTRYHQLVGEVSW